MFGRIGVNRIMRIQKTRFFSTMASSMVKTKIDPLNYTSNTYIYDVYKLQDLKFKNFKIINTYDEYYDTIVKNEYFTDYGEVSKELQKELTKSENEKKEKGTEVKKNEDHMLDHTKSEYMGRAMMEHTSNNVIISNDLQVLFFGSYDNNLSIVLFEKFKNLIEKNHRLNFYFIDVNVCPQGSYNCQIQFVPTVMLIYKNHLYRNKIEASYERSVNEQYIADFINKVQQNIDLFHSYNNKFIYELEKQSNYLNTKYIDIDNQNIHKENWNTY